RRRCPAPCIVAIPQEFLHRHQPLPRSGASKVETSRTLIATRRRLCHRCVMSCRRAAGASLRDEIFYWSLPHRRWQQSDPIVGRKAALRCRCFRTLFALAILFDCGARTQLLAVSAACPMALADQSLHLCTSPPFAATFRSGCV